MPILVGIGVSASKALEALISFSPSSALEPIMSLSLALYDLGERGLKWCRQARSKLAVNLR